MRISEIAAHAGVSVPTIRFYERRGLLQPPRRRASGYRDYPLASVLVVRFIKALQEHGFSLAEIAALLQAYKQQVLTPVQLRGALRDKQNELDERIAVLQAARTQLLALHASVNETHCRELSAFCQLLRNAAPD